MTPNSLFIALSKTLIESGIQAFAIWIVIKAVFLVVPALSARTRYAILYLTMAVLSVAFISTLLLHLEEMKSATGLREFIISADMPATKSTVGLLDRLLSPQFCLLLSVFYVTGLIVNMIRLCAGVIQVNRILSYNTTEQIKIWDDRLQLLARKVNLNKKIKLYFSYDAMVPFTTGFIKPLILFPVACINQLSIQQVEAILLHELAHIKRHDYLLNLIQQVMGCILFFNPFAVLVSREISELREYCCDDMVKNHVEEVSSYASALLIIEENRKNTLHLAMTSNGHRKYYLLNRIKRIMMKTPENSPIQKLAIFLTVLAITISVAWNIPDRNLQLTTKEAAKTKVTTGKKTSDSPADSLSGITVSSKETTKPQSAALSRISFLADTSLKRKSKIKIIVEDAQGNKQEYNSLKELPEDLKGELLADKLYKSNKDAEKAVYAQADILKGMLNSAEWKAQQEALTKHFSSDEWKKQQDAIVKHFSGPEWKKVQDDIVKHFSSDEWKKQQDAIVKQFTGPEWKNYQGEVMEDLRKATTELDVLRKNGKDTERMEKPELPEKPEKPEMPELPEKPERPERPEKPEQPAKPD